ncbi:hypothetical protein BD779DRAFT_1552261 [Infundibulicybe gibba]|nr:hypothetical protein BD779DRAFT_1552261 [Infundibulicybe gibba]
MAGAGRLGLLASVVGESLGAASASTWREDLDASLAAWTAGCGRPTRARSCKPVAESSESVFAIMRGDRNGLLGCFSSGVCTNDLPLSIDKIMTPLHECAHVKPHVSLGMPTEYQS